MKQGGEQGVAKQHTYTNERSHVESREITIDNVKMRFRVLDIRREKDGV